MKLEKLVDAYVSKYINIPKDVIIFDEDILLVSLKEELPKINKDIKHKITIKLLRETIHKHLDLGIDLSGEDQDIYDAIFCCVYLVTRKLFDRDDCDEDIEFDSTWSESMTDSFKLIVRPASSNL